GADLAHPPLAVGSASRPRRFLRAAVHQGFKLARMRCRPRAACGKLKPVALKLRCQQRRIARHGNLRRCGHFGSSHRDLVPCQGKAHSMPGKFERGQLRASEMRTPCRAIPCVEMLTLWLYLVKLTSIVP